MKKTILLNKNISKRYLNKKGVLIGICLFPMFVFLIFFTLIPLITAAKDSFFEVSLLDTLSRKFSGLGNYQMVSIDANVQQSLRNTVFYLVVSIFVETVIGISIALIFQNNFRGRGILIAVLMIPWALPPLVNGILWRFIFDPSNGLWNSFLNSIGVIDSYRVWLNDPVFSKWCVIAVHIWKMLPLITVLFIARIQTLPDEIIEASKIDGAGAFQRFITILFPHLKPVLFITMSQGTIGAFHLFDEAFAMTGTALDTRSLLIQDYLIAFREYNLGNGMALALIISVIILLLMAVYSRIGREDE